jgi:N-acetylglucosamine kinase-like BadF-type ATPase
MLLGLDIGGSSSRARLRANGRAPIEVEGPGANVATLDARVVDDRLTALLAGLGEMHPAACCAGAAGAEIPAARERLEALLGRMLPGCRLSVVHDARLVLAAAGLDAGIALVAGTGSVAYGRTADGREAQRGGWGWMLGDGGSGVWITREAAREVMARADDRRAVGPLGEALLAACRAGDAHELTASLHRMREPMQWAAVASTVFATFDADEASREIVSRGADALASLVGGLRESLVIAGPVVLGGGLLLHHPQLESAVRDRLGSDCIRLVEPPVEGALRLAEQMLLG